MTASTEQHIEQHIEPPPRYQALALQHAVRSVSGLSPDEASAARLAAVERLAAAVRGSKAFIGPDLRLVVLPEYCLTSFPLGEPVARWQAIGCVAPDGPEYDALAAIAVENDVYLSGNLYELDPAFPALYFQCSFLLSPSGERLLHYRRLLSLFAPSPHDLLSPFLDRYGPEALFPVAETPLGRMAAIASEEILYPEIARAFALRGAEIFLHSTSEVATPQLSAKSIARRARAQENLCWIVSANSAGVLDTPIPSASADAMSTIVDYRGRALVEAGAGESMVAHDFIDLAAQRAYRRRPGMQNLLARQRLELFSATYQQRVCAPDWLVTEGQLRVPARSEFIARQRETIAALVAAGVIK